MDVIRLQTDIAKMGLDLGGVMALVAERSRELTRADGSVIELAEEEHMVYRASAGSVSNLLGLRLARNGSLSGLFVKQGIPLRCDDSELDGRVDLVACRAVGLRSMVVVPLKHGAHVVGVLKVVSRRPDAFTVEDEDLLGLLSGLVAAAMYHATVFDFEELVHRATHDPLTGLPNRALFYDRLRQQFAQATASSSEFAVLNLDMDGLKPINDRYGHRFGDAAIIAVAERLRSQTRHTDIAARLGGDEFAVLLGDLRQPEDVQAFVERLNRSIREPFTMEEQPLLLAASIGVAVFPKDGKDPESLMENADQSMYGLKRTQPGRQESVR